MPDTAYVAQRYILFIFYILLSSYLTKLQVKSIPKFQSRGRCGALCRDGRMCLLHGHGQDELRMP